MISAAYLDQLRQMGEARGFGEGSGKRKRTAPLIALCDALETRDVLDYGCAHGGLSRALTFPIRGYDPGVETFSAEPEPADVVCCFDVMEHVEPEYVDATLAKIAGLAKKAALFSISTKTSKELLPDGRNAHLTVQDYDWWLEKLAAHFEIEKYERAADQELWVWVK